MTKYLFTRLNLQFPQILIDISFTTTERNVIWVLTHITFRIGCYFDILSLAPGSIRTKSSVCVIPDVNIWSRSDQPIEQTFEFVILVGLKKRLGACQIDCVVRSYFLPNRNISITISSIYSFWQYILWVNRWTGQDRTKRQWQCVHISLFPPACPVGAAFASALHLTPCHC